MNATWFNRICLFLAFAGIFVAGFLSLSYALNVTIPCGIGHGCDVVSRSGYSKWLDLPVAYYGLVGYLVLAFLGVARAFGIPAFRRTAPLLGLLISGAGTLVSFYLIYLSIFVIKATCTWCLASASIMTLSLIFHAGLVQASEGSELKPRADGILIGLLAILSLGGLGFRGVSLEKIRNDPLGPGKLDLTRGKAIEDFVPDDSHALGPKDAPMTVVEFGDLTCPHCKDSYYHMKAIVAASNGNVRFVFRHFPLYQMEGHEMSLSAAVISELAAEKDKFWQFVEGMFNVEKPESMTAQDLMGIAGAVGLDPEAIRTRVSNENDLSISTVHRDLEFGSNYGISSTPTFFVGLKGQQAEAKTASTIQETLKSAKYARYAKGV